MQGKILLILPFLLVTPVIAEEVDLDVVHRIKAEAISNSQVMEYVFRLTDLNGPRLTGSPGMERAASTARDTMQSLGIDAEIQLAGKVVRPWSLNDVHVAMREPVATPIKALPMAWTGGTDGKVRAEVVMAPLADDPAGDANLENLAKRIEAYQKEYAGQLAGKIVLLSGAIEVTLPEEAVQTRLDDAALADIFSNETLDPVDPLSWPIWDYPAYTDNWRNWAEVPLNVNAGYYELYSAVWNRLSGFLATEGVVAILKSDSRGDGSVIHADDFGNWLPGAAPEPPTLALSADQYNRIVRLVERDIAVELEIDVDITTSDEAADLRNVVATIPGGRKRNEVVMLGGHLDSWHGAVGATDNAAGCAVAMEAMRILKALDLNMDRTVRMALWDGEEQNYYGSRAYVQENFADRVSMQTKPAHARLSAYYNVDNGAGKIRGVYLQSNDMARPIFESWFAPLADLDVDTVSIRATTETDHLAFDTVGLPGFQFIQDPLEYESRSHHTDEDSMDRIVPADLKQAAAVLAIVVYHTANRAELMPRKPLPKPLPEPVELPEILR